MTKRRCRSQEVTPWGVIDIALEALDLSAIGGDPAPVICRLIDLDGTRGPLTLATLIWSCAAAPHWVEYGMPARGGEMSGLADSAEIAGKDAAQAAMAVLNAVAVGDEAGAVESCHLMDDRLFTSTAAAVLTFAGLCQRNFSDDGYGRD